MGYLFQWYLDHCRYKALHYLAGSAVIGVAWYVYRHVIELGSLTLWFLVPTTVYLGISAVIGITAALVILAGFVNSKDRW